jgi:hypothetical protein
MRGEAEAIHGPAAARSICRAFSVEKRRGDTRLHNCRRERVEGYSREELDCFGFTSQ